MKKILTLLIVILILSSCKSYEVSDKSYDSSKEIVILYTNALNPLDEKREFYSRVSAYKKELLENTPNVTLVDTGNISDTDRYSYNLYIDVMNKVGYDYACFGIYDFKNGVKYVYQNTKHADFKYLLCCASYNGLTNDVFKKTAPYEVVDYDGIKIGYLGIISPRFNEEKPEYFLEKERSVVNFYDETEEVFYDTIQCSIDKLKDLGAEYVVAISNFDTQKEFSPYTLKELISNLSGVDVVINANEYSQTEELTISDKEHNNVFTVTNGPIGSHLGKITIVDGSFTNTSLDEYNNLDDEIKEYYDSIIK